MSQSKGLYDPGYEHDACGVGFVVNVNGQRSHQIVTDGITILKNLTHRGAVGGDSKTGDGTGMLVQMPHRFFAKECGRLSIALPAEGSYGVGMVFLPQEGLARKPCCTGSMSSFLTARTREPLLPDGSSRTANSSAQHQKAKSIVFEVTPSPASDSYQMTAEFLETSTTGFPASDLRPTFRLLLERAAPCNSSGGYGQ